MRSTRRLLAFSSGFALTAICVGALPQSSLREFKASRALSGVIRSWGSDDMAPLMKRWERGFRAFQADVVFEDTLKGSATAHAGLYTGVADLALMGRETLLIERYGMFTRTHHYPLEITVATGSCDAADKTFALTVFVNAGNPISRLTLMQLDGIFGAERSGGWDETKFEWHTEVARGPERDLRTWGQLGLTGEWADKPIHVYGYPLTTYAEGGADTGAMFFFRTKVLAGADKWNFDIREYENGRDMVHAMAGDRYAIGYTGLCYGTPEIKPVALASSDGGAAILPTRQTVTDGTYPLTRSIYICIDRTPGRPVESKTAEFLRYVLSRQGQEAVAKDDGYLPLTPEAAAEQLRKLD